MQICTSLGESARDYVNLCEFAWICVGLHEFMGICMSLRESARVYVNLREITQICTRLRKSAQVCANLRGFTRICLSLHKSARHYANLRNIMWICANLREITKIWLPFYFWALKMWKLIMNYHAKSGASSLKIDWVMLNLVYGGHFVFWRYVSQWVSDDPRYKAAFAAKNVDDFAWLKDTEGR